MTNEEMKAFEQRAIEYFVRNENGFKETSRRYIWKAHIKGYTEEIDGKKVTYKLNLKWYRMNMTEEQKKELKRYIKLVTVATIISMFAELGFQKTVKMTNSEWNEDQEMLANLLLTIAFGQLCYGAIMRMGNHEKEPEMKEVTGSDEGIQQDSGI